MMQAVNVALASEAVLGECPLWSNTLERLLWVDTLGQTLNLFDPASGKNQILPMPGQIGFVAESPSRRLIVGIGCDVAEVDWKGRLRVLTSVPDAGDRFRLNDARFDAHGRLWVGLMHQHLIEGTGRLYRLDEDLTWHECDRGFTLVNGLDWSADRKILYATDSRRGDIYAYDYDLATGAIGPRRDFFHIDPNVGKPDGLLVDPKGFILSVLFDGAAILRIAPNGQIDSRYELPVPRPTSCALVNHGKLLYVTTARLGLTQDALAGAPLSGALLSMEYSNQQVNDGAERGR